MWDRIGTGFQGSRLSTRLRVLASLAALVVLVLASVILAVSSCSDRISQASAIQEQGDIEGALSVYENILSQEPDDTEALEGASVCLLLLGRYDEALVFQERLAGLDPNNAQVRVELGFNYLNHQGRPVDAANVLGEAASLDPSAKNLTYWAQALIACGEQGRAEEVLRRVIETEPSYAHSYEVLYRLLCSQARADEAQQLLEQAAGQGVVVSSLPSR